MPIPLKNFATDAAAILNQAYADTFAPRTHIQRLDHWGGEYRVQVTINGDELLFHVGNGRSQVFHISEMPDDLKTQLVMIKTMNRQGIPLAEEAAYEIGWCDDYDKSEYIFVISEQRLKELQEGAT